MVSIKKLSGICRGFDFRQSEKSGWERPPKPARKLDVQKTREAQNSFSTAEKSTGGLFWSLCFEPFSHGKPKGIPRTVTTATKFQHFMTLPQQFHSPSDMKAWKSVVSIKKLS